MTAQIVEAPTFELGAALGQDVAVKIDSAGLALALGAAETTGIGFLNRAGAIGDRRSVDLFGRHARTAIAAGVIAIGANVAPAAAGDWAAGGTKWVSLTASTAQGDEILICRSND